MNNPLSFNHRVPKLQTQQRKQRNYQNLKQAPMNWKNFAMSRPRNLSMEDMERTSTKNSVRGYHSPSFYEQNAEIMNGNGMSSLSQKKMREENLRLSGVTYNKRQQHAQRAKQQTMRRVKLLQDKVLPMISSENRVNDQENEEYGFAWQLKMEQKLLKVENAIDKVKNQVQIKYEKRLIEIQRHWEDRISQLMDLIESSVVENGVGEEEEFEKQDSGLINDDTTAGNGFIRGHTVSDNQGKEEYAFYRSGFDEN